MEANNQQQNPEPASLQQRSSDRVIQPLNPNITPSSPITPVQANPSVASSAPVASSYDPTTDTGYKVPSLNLSQPIPDTAIKRVASKHKSLMILAILGLLSTVFTVYSAIQISHAIQNAQLANKDTGAAQFGLDIVYGGIIFNLIIYVYFLLAKDPHTVATILKVLLVLEFINVFGVFWGGSPTKVINLLLDGAYLLFTYVVYDIVKIPSGYS